MDFTHLANQADPTVTSLMASVNNLDKLMMGFVVLYLCLVTFAIPPALAFLCLVAFNFKRMWTFLRALVWNGLLAYISWVTSVASFLFTISAFKVVSLFTCLILLGLIRTTMLLFVVFTLPLGYIVIHFYVYAGVLLILALLSLRYLVILGREQQAILVLFLVAVTMIVWKLALAWEWFWEEGPGADHLAQAEEEWECERLGVIISVGLDGLDGEWLEDDIEW